MSTMSPTRWERDLLDVAVLTDPVRRTLYEYVTSSPMPVGRDEAARAAGISRSLAAFHLDRLVEAGLLVPEFARLSGRTGPGAGRPAKLYRRASRTFAVSVPPRDYEVPARVLAESVSASARSREDAFEQARTRGVAAGQEVRRRATGRGRKRLLAALHDALRDQGFEPRVESPQKVRLSNCPFDSLSRDFTDLMCGMNHAMLQGMVEGLGVPGVTAELQPEPGSCCVRVRLEER
jgi:predicted ArsR family transcriptional regulator